MRFLILNTDYPAYLSWLYTQHPGLEGQPFEAQRQVRMESAFGLADFYSASLRKLGHEAWDVHINNEFLQRAWAGEHGVPFNQPTRTEKGLKTLLRRARRIASKAPLRYLKPPLRPVVRLLDRHDSWFYDLLAAQVRYFKPDVLLNHAVTAVDSNFLRELRSDLRLVVGQFASPLPGDVDLSCYDMMLSPSPPFVQRFRNCGMPAELLRFAFEPRILDALRGANKNISVSFVGGVSIHHKARIGLLEFLCRQTDVGLWGDGFDTLADAAALRQHYRGNAWGMNMYRILQGSKITINNHIDVAGSYGGNMRLYEATGVGTLLVTDWKTDLCDMFESGKEIAAYRSSEECLELLRYYLWHEKEREQIARAGQQRTLREHTYYHRMQQLVEIIRKYM